MKIYKNTNMKTAVIIHGMPSKKEYFEAKNPSQSNKHWLPWIQRQLILKGILAQTLEFPEPYKSDYKKWKTMLKRFDINKNTVLIGHSLGAGFLVRWLSENKVKVGKVILVAPWIDPKHTLKTGFFNFKINPNIAKRTLGITIIASKDDYRDVVKSAKQLENILKDDNVKFNWFENKGHFTMKDMKTEKFPELLKEIF